MSRSELDLDFFKYRAGNFESWMPRSKLDLDLLLIQSWELSTVDAEIKA